MDGRWEFLCLYDILWQVCYNGFEKSDTFKKG